MKEFTNYQYYFDDKGAVYAVSTYAGKVVRGKAQCSSSDEFDEEFGKALAAKRCDFKVANKRYKRAAAEYEEAQRAYDMALARLNKAESYFVDASRRLAQSGSDLITFTNVAD